MQNVSVSNVKIAGSHGYRIEGDVAFLNAEVDVASPNLDGTQWALQLWACNEPYWGGPISGMKVAEAPVSFPEQAGLNRVAAEAIVSAPAMRGDYSMVLVVASRTADALEQVHDFANYAARESFVAPHLDGAVGYAIDGDSVVLKAGRVVNPRPAFSLSGGLALELWALSQPFCGGALDGTRLASAELGVIGGSYALVEQELRVPFTPPPAGEWHVVMVLREQTSNANVTRDFCNFQVTFTSSVAAPAVEKPAAVEPVVAKTASAELALAKPATTKPAAAKSAAAEPAGAKPVAAKPAVAEPVAAKPVAARLAVAEPVAPKPVAAKPAVAEPVAAKPVAAKPAVAEPAVAGPVAAKPAVAEPVTSEQPAAKVSVQTATLEALMQVKGISRKLALEIIRSRPFQSLEDLLRVRGIGESLLRKLKPFLTL